MFHEGWSIEKAKKSNLIAQMVKLKTSNVAVVPWSRSFGASVEHFPNVDWLVSMVFEVLQSELDNHCEQKTSKKLEKVFSAEFFWVNFYLREGCEVAANESKPGFKVSNMCCVWPGEKILWVLIVKKIYFYLLYFSVTCTCCCVLH